MRATPFHFANGRHFFIPLSMGLHILKNILHGRLHKSAWSRYQRPHCSILLLTMLCPVVIINSRVYPSHLPIPPFCLYLIIKWQSVLPRATHCGAGNSHLSRRAKKYKHFIHHSENIMHFSLKCNRGFLFLTIYYYFEKIMYVYLPVCLSFRALLSFYFFFECLGNPIADVTKQNKNRAQLAARRVGAYI